tara:strand:- start:624 stop:743 length:120 start_codon:yes stop_codon:yes gene_type:complete
MTTMDMINLLPIEIYAILVFLVGVILGAIIYIRLTQEDK